MKNEGTGEKLFPENGPCIVLVTEGSARVTAAMEELTLRQGEAAFISARSVPLRVSGSATLYFAATNLNV
jgi:mannose-6-phosphate isomerase class I